MLRKWLGHRQSQIINRYYHQQDKEAQRQMLRIRPVEDQHTAPTDSNPAEAQQPHDKDTPDAGAGAPAAA